MTDALRIFSRRTRVAVAAAVFLAHLAFVSFALPTGRSEVNNDVRNLCTGVILSQPLLLAVLALLGPFPLLKQISVAAIGVIAMVMIAAARDTIGANISIIEVVAFLAWFTALCIPLALVRWWRGTRITLFASDRIAPPNQFSLRWLVTLIFVVALTCAVLRYASADEEFGLDSIPWLQFAAFFAAIVPLLGGSLMAISVMLTSRSRLQPMAVCCLLVVIACGLCAKMLTQLETQVSFEDMFWMVGWMECGVLLSIVATLLPFRWCGYRLTRVEKTAGENPA